MIINFLSAKMPLTKTFSVGADGSIEKSPYPLVRNFTSHEERVTSLDEFYAVLNSHAMDNHCLLKGQLNRALNDESRAGSTNPADSTEWMCFDLDNLVAIDSAEQFVTTILPPSFHDISFILQHSASAGVSQDKGIRAHLFFLLSKPAAPEMLKLFVTALNLEQPVLNAQLSLTAAGTSLRYPVDRSVNQNDKLIYIAPPKLVGLTDQLAGQRISLVRGARERVNIDWSAVKSPAQVEQLVNNKVTTLRENAGLKGKTGKLKTLQTGELLLTNPDVGVVTGERRGRGFVYLNLNGGDSWAYYYPEDNPQYLFNFKGEPVVELAKIAPTYWASLQDHVQQSPSVDERAQPFAFRRHETDSLHVGVWDGVNKTFVIPPAQIKRESLADFFGVYSQEPPCPIAHWRYEFDPTNATTFDPAGKFCNQFELSSVMRNAKPDATHVPPTIDRVIHSVVGDDTDSYHHFMNWLACIYQNRRKTGTAWVFHGVEGTGKGVLFNEILSPMFGKRYCALKQIGNLEDQFNADLEHCLFLVIDEARIDDSKSTKRILNRVKNLITEEEQSIRGMRANAVQAKNFTNLMFFSNDYDSLAISQTDRRFNVAPRQERRLEISIADIETLRHEVAQFAGYLAAYKVDAQKARTALNNEAKRQLREASQDALEQMCQAIIDGNMEYFMQYAETGVTALSNNLVAWSQYLSTMRRWLDTANTDSVATRDEIQAAYMYLMSPSAPPGPHKFGRMLAHKNLLIRPVYAAHAKAVIRGVPVKWNASPEQITTWSRVLKPASDKQPRAEDHNVAAWNKSLSA